MTLHNTVFGCSKPSIKYPNLFQHSVHAVVQRIVWIATTICMKFFSNFYIYNREHLKNLPTPLLVIANHHSYWDSMIIGTLFPFFSTEYLPIGFMADDSLYDNILHRIFFNLTGTYKAGRGEGYDVSLAYPRHFLLKNRVFLIFPYGKILINELTTDKPQRGIAILAREFSNLTILPIYLKTTPRAGLIIRSLFKRYEMGVIVGKPFKLDPKMYTLTVEDLADRLVGQITQASQTNEKT